MFDKKKVSGLKYINQAIKVKLLSGLNSLCASEHNKFRVRVTPKKCIIGVDLQYDIFLPTAFYYYTVNMLCEKKFHGSSKAYLCQNLKVIVSAVTILILYSSPKKRHFG